MADVGRTGEANLNEEALKLVDPYIKQIIDTAKYVALYTFENDAWTKTKIQGSLFVYARTAEPLYNMLILNRLDKQNWIEPITTQLDLQRNEPYLLYKNNAGKICGIWFFEQAECVRISKLVQSLMHQSTSSRPTHQVENRNGPVDIFRMLTQAQEAFTASDPSDPKPQVDHSGPTSNSVAEFFAKAGTGEPAMAAKVSEGEGGLGGLLQQLKVNPVHSVEHIEKQQRVTTPLSADPGTTVDPLKQLMRPRSMEVERRMVVEGSYPASGSANGHLIHTQSQPMQIPSQPVLLANGGLNMGFMKKTSSPPGFPVISSEEAQAQNPDLMPPAMFTPRDPAYLPLRPCEVPALSREPDVPHTSARPAGFDSPEPLTRNQLMQALRYLLTNDADFITKIHEAYVKSLTEKML